MSFSTASAILRGKWLIEPAYAMAQLPMILRMIERGSELEPSLFSHLSSSKGNAGELTDVRQPVRMAVLGASAPVYQVGPRTYVDALPKGCIAMMDITGPVLKYGDACSYGLMDSNNVLAELANCPSVKGVILNIDSPGGQADGTALFAQTIRDTISQKPVLSIVQDGIAASAGMWIASAAQELYVTQATDQVGSIGAYVTLYDFAGYFEQKGVKVHEIYAPQSSDKNKDYYDALKGDETLIKDDLQFLVQDFINTVKSNRGARLNTKDENPFTGKMYRAADAKKIGLIDGIKPLSGVVARMNQLIKLRE